MKRKSAYNDDWASKARSAEHRLDRFEERETPPEKADVQDVRMRLGRRTHRQGRVPAARALDRRDRAAVRRRDPLRRAVGVVGPNGTGKTHFLRLLAGEEIAHEGEWRLGRPRRRRRMFAQLHERADVGDLPIVDVLRKKGLDR